MDLEIKYVKDKGIINKERLVLNTISKTNVGFYLVLDTTFNEDDEPTNLLRHSFWFPDKDIQKGDVVVLYTKEGIDKEIINKKGNRTHFFYWGLKKTVWNIKGEGAVLIEVNNWSSKKV
jgi:hypothetical protein